MKFNNNQFGELEIELKHIINFPDGVLGFENCKDFVLVEVEDSLPFKWLVSIQDSELSFPLIEPSELIDTYDVPGADKAVDQVLLIAILKEPFENSSVNLRSPIVINNSRCMGKQVILENESLPFEMPFHSNRSSINKE